MPRFLVYILLFLGIVAAALIFMPLRLAVSLAGLEDNNFSAKQISGSIWNGRIESGKLGPIELGNLDAGLQFLPLLTGAVKMDLSREASGLESGITATIGKSNNILLVENTTATFQAGRQLAPLPTSDINLEDVSIAFAEGQCRSASGKVRVSLDANIPGLDLQRGLLGNAECRGGILVLPLVSGSGMEQLTLKLKGDGSYTARLLISGSNVAWDLLLPTLGFRKTPEGYAIKIGGDLPNQS